MTPSAIVNVLDNHGRREHLGDGLHVWHKVKGWHAKISQDNQVMWVAYNIRPGVWMERVTRFAQPYC